MGGIKVPEIRGVAPVQCRSSKDRTVAHAASPAGGASGVPAVRPAWPTAPGSAESELSQSRVRVTSGMWTDLPCVNTARS